MPMGKRIFFVIAFLMLSFLLISPVLAADVNIDYDAELSKVCKASHCTIPIPTLVDPNEKIIKIDQDFYLTGLTWNNTKIDIYVDNKYQGSATVVNDDDSDTANFYYLIENNSLLEGVHEWKVIAWAETLRKRSYVSRENSFTIENYFLAPTLEKISKDIDGNNWIIGSAEDNSIVSIYVDNVYQGEVRTDGNFNYNIGQLSPGLHTFYALARQADTGRSSKRSNILSEQIVVEDFNQSGDEDQTIEEEPIVPTEPEEEDQISSISEEKEENNIIIQDEESQDNVNVSGAEEHDVEVGVISHEESQDQLVVDGQKSELSEEDKEEENTISEELQTATPDDELSKILMEDLDLVEKQERNRKLGLWLLVVLIVIVVASTSLSGKKSKSKLKDTEKKDDDSNSHQGDLFNRE